MIVNLLHAFVLSFRHASLLLTCLVGLAWRPQGWDPERPVWGRRKQEVPIQRRDPVEEMREFERTRKYTDAELRKVFGKESNPAFAQRLMQTNPVRYQEMKKEAAFLDLVGPGSVTPDATSDHRKFSPDELRVRLAHSEEKVRRLYKADPKAKDYNPGESLEKIAKENPALYADLKLAAISYGILSPEAATTVRTQPTPKLKTDAPFIVNPELCKQFNIPVGTKMTEDEFLAVTNVYYKHQEALRQAAQDAAAKDKAAGQQ